MSGTFRSERPLPGPLQALVGRLGALVLLLAAGVALGLQYVQPNKRVIAVMVALLLFGVTWRIDMVSGLGVLILALPFPRSTVFGSTNLAFVLLVLVIWLLRVSQGQLAAPRRTPLDLPIVALFISYVVSFYNVTTSVDLAQALERFELIVACMLMFIVIVNTVQREADLRRLLYFQTVSVAAITLIGMWELAHPGSTLVPGWIDFVATTGQVFSTRGVRPGSMFFDFELYSEYCALSALMLMFLMLRSSSVARRVTLAALLGGVVFMLLATCTRGSIVSLAVGLPYLIWRVRRRLSFVTLVTVLVLGAVGFLSAEWYVANYTRSGSVIERLTQTKFVGLVPDSRVTAWAAGWERMMQHPFIGHGPYYSVRTGTRIWFWPHNLYLYVGNSIGIIGLGVFVWLLVTLLRISWPRTDDLVRGDFAKSYLIIAHTQMVVFVVDQIKIEYLRNYIYQFQIWLMFSLLVAAHRISSAPPESQRAAPPAGRLERP